MADHLYSDEEWRVINGTDGHYEVSSFGRVRRALPGRGTLIGRVIRPCKTQGYLMARLSLPDGVKIRRSVHQLVIETFCGPRPSETHQVAHIDGDPENNAVSNLCWATPSENCRHKIRHGTWGIKLSLDDVFAIRASAAPASELAKRFGVNKSAIIKIRARETWKLV